MDGSSTANVAVERCVLTGERRDRRSALNRLEARCRPPAKNPAEKTTLFSHRRRPHTGEYKRVPAVEVGAPAIRAHVKRIRKTAAQRCRRAAIDRFAQSVRRVELKSAREALVNLELHAVESAGE